MKKLLLILLCLPLLFSSCKKEEEMEVGLINGCTDPAAMNYDPAANTDDGNCTYCVDGCMDATQFNYDPNATCDDGSCIPFMSGCTDIDAINYNPDANTDDGTCEFENVSIGDLHAGGIVIYVDESGKHGLVCALSEYEGKVWISTYVIYQDSDGNPSSIATNTSIGGGYQNTSELVEAFGSEPPVLGVSNVAYKFCVNYQYNNRGDWFLPSKGTMSYIDQNLNTINNSLLSNAGMPFTISQFHPYWTSNRLSFQTTWDMAWCYTFVVGHEGQEMNWHYTVRPVRQF